MTENIQTTGRKNPAGRGLVKQETKKGSKRAEDKKERKEDPNHHEPPRNTSDDTRTTAAKAQQRPSAPSRTKSRARGTKTYMYLASSRWLVHKLPTATLKRVTRAWPCTSSSGLGRLLSMRQTVNQSASAAQQFARGIISTNYNRAISIPCPWSCPTPTHPSTATPTKAPAWKVASSTSPSTAAAAAAAAAEWQSRRNGCGHCSTEGLYGWAAACVLVCLCLARRSKVSACTSFCSTLSH
ncbi:hypothetical protein HDV57DRAFT_45731 [Trichoderma longibrachiatum]